jgi:integrase
VADLLRAAEGWRYEALVYVLLGAGLRIAEALGLTWGAVDLDDGTLEVRGQVREYEGTGKVWERTTKTGSRRTVALGAVTVAKLRAHRVAMIEERMALGAGAPSEDDLVFPNEFHEIGDRSNIARMLKQVAADGGLEGVHPHKLRHTHVSLALDAGVPLEAISEQVGHRSIRTTKDVYGQLQDRGRRRVADAVDDALGG